MTSLIYGIYKDVIHMNLLAKQRLTENKLVILPGRRMGGIVREFGMDMYTLLYLKWMTNKDLLYSTGDSAQCYVAAWMGGGLGEDGFMYTYG